MLPRRFIPVVLSCAVLLAIPASAVAANAVIRDAQDGSVTCKHSISALRGAQGQISPEEAEYSDIDEAISAGIAKKRSGGCSITDNPAKEPAIKGKLTEKPKRAERGAFLQKNSTRTATARPTEIEVTEDGDIVEPGGTLRGFDDDAKLSDDDESALAASGTKGDGEGGGAGMWLPIGMLLLLAAFGLSFWRVKRRRRASH